MRERLEPPVRPPFYWVRFFTPEMKNGRVVDVNPNPFFETRVRIMSDLIDASMQAQTVAGQPALQAIWDNQNREIADHAGVTVDLSRRQDEFVKTARPEDWEHRRMARDFEAILDRTYLPSPTFGYLSGIGIIVSESTPQDLKRRGESATLKVLTKRTEEILAKTSTTNSFHRFVAERIQLAYRWGAPATQVLDLKFIGLDLDRNSFDLFDPGKTAGIERWAYEDQVIAIGILSSPQLKQELAEGNERWRQEFKIRYGKDLS